MTIDTACSSSLVAIDGAVEKLRGGLCTSALVGGVNLMLSPHLFVAFCRARMLAPDGRCKTFDARANGYARGEGAGGAVLVPLEEARQKGMKVVSIVRGTCVNHDGRSASLTAPNGPAQQAVIAGALQSAGLHASDVCFVEAHGTGTALGDPIEMGALRAVYGSSPLSPKRGESPSGYPFVIGALKSNIGHLEGSAGIAGFIKLALCLTNRVVPPNLHFTTLNPYIDLGDWAVHFPTEPHKLRQRKAIGGVSSFGFGGANAHIIMEEGESAAVEGSETEVKAAPKQSHRIAFLYTGQGSQYVNMGKTLFEAEREFKEGMQQCAVIADKLLPTPLLDTVYPEGEDVAGAEARLHEARYLQPALFSVEYSLTRLLKSKGVTPDIVLGHSFGEYVAAVAAGALTLQDALTVVCQRGKIMSEMPAQDGVMAACRVSEKEASDAIGKANGQGTECATVGLAAINGAKNCVLAGARSEVEAVLRVLGVQEKAMFLNVSHAFHSPLMLPTVEPIRETCRAVKSRRLKVPMVSTVTGKEVSGADLTPDHWAMQGVRPVRFLEAMKTAVNLGADVFVEVGAKPTLTKLGKQCVDSTKFSWINCLDSHDDGLFTKGLDAVKAVVENVHVWKRSRLGWCRPFHPFVPMRSEAVGAERRSSSWLRKDVGELLKDHMVHGVPIMPGAGFVDIFAAWALFLLPMGSDDSDFAAEISNLEIELPLSLKQDRGPLQIDSVIGKDDVIEIVSIVADEVTNHARGVAHASNRAQLLTRVHKAQEVGGSFDMVKQRFAESGSHSSMPPSVLYEGLRKIGLQYGPRFRTIREIYKGDNEVLSKLEVEGTPAEFEKSFVVHPAILDGAFQSAAVILASEKSESVYVPVSVGEVLLSTSTFEGGMWSYVTLQSRDATAAKIDVTLFEAGGRVTGFLKDVLLKQVDLSPPVDIPKDLLWKVEWKEAAVGDALAPQEQWLVCGAESEGEPSTKNSLGSGHTYVEAGKLPSGDALQSLLAQQPWGAVVYVGGLQRELPEAECLTEALHLTQGFSRLLSSPSRPAVMPKLVLVTERAQKIADRKMEQTPKHAGLLGFCRTARLEIDSSGKALKIVYVDVEDSRNLRAELESAMKSVLVNEEYEPELGVRKGAALVPRLARCPLQLRGWMELHMTHRGALSNLKLRPLSLSGRSRVPAEMCEVRVRAVGLNFRDVLNVMGLYPGDPGMKESDRGRVVAVV
eukprot:GHVU01001701.1.p1 GENE.GHVU01001701.1~~GHVU01001701.1.p1  ORF type:complete len:1228 (+),score=205.25 GHVU01001701.1:46-3684(+)